VTVEFKMSPAMNDVFQATVTENVSLIKSIPSQYFTDVEGLVMRSVQRGGDLSGITDELEKRYGITRRRAAFIARDQNNKANATFTRVRQQELGVTEAIWLHSAGGKEPRPSHVAFSGKTYNIREGALIDGKRIWPGELPNCRCVSRPVVPGFN
jgi:SPP1 gp7 family putative phage head morphogenesis protein